MENKSLQKSRETMYRFLSGLYIREVEEWQWKAMCQMKFPVSCPNEDMQEGYQMMEHYLKESAGRDTQSMLDELAVDYARIFLSAGVAQGKAAFPYESVYTSKKHLMMQDSRNEVVALFSAKGVTPSKDMYRIPEDHLGLLLEYMAVLCAEDSKESRMEQADFLKDHLNNWIGAFCAEVQKYSNTDFYKGLAKLTKGFLAMECSLLQEVE